MEMKKIDQIMPDVVEAKLLSAFLQDPKRLQMSDTEQMEIIKRIEEVGRKLKERQN